jgi:hypothetical protein
MAKFLLPKFHGTRGIWRSGFNLFHHCKKKGAAINGKKVLAFATSYKPFPTVY